MKRLLPILTLALLGLSACDSGTLVSPLEPEVGGPSFAKAVLPAFEPQEACPDGKTCLVEPIALERGKGAPSTWTSAPFEGTEGEMATLVVQTSNPKTTTMRAWLNGATVLLPSVIPQEWPESEAEPQEVRVSFPLAEGDNVLEVRLSAKPGTQVVFWVEAAAVAPTDGGEIEPPPETFPFALTPAVPPPSEGARADACAALGDYVPADWTNVMDKNQHWEELSALLSSGMAWILLEGFPGFQEVTFLTTTDYYYLITGSADFANLYGPDQNLGPDQLWMMAASLGELGQSGQQPVLCIATP